MPIFSLDFNTIFERAKAAFEAKTGYALERFDAERLMLQIFSGEIYNWGSEWLDASNQIFLKYMSGQQLDDYGASMGGTDGARLASTPATCTVRFNFTATLESYYTIKKNTVVTGFNDNGTFSFYVTEDAIIPPGVDFCELVLEERNDIGANTNSGALANDILIGDMTTLLDPSGIYSVIDSVENVNESEGGTAGEADERYLSRLEHMLDASSTAGTYESYLFWAKAATVKVLDAELEKLGWAFSLYVLPMSFENVVYGDASVQISNLTLTGATLSNTDHGRLYWNLTGAPVRVFTLYKDAAKTTAVATCSHVNGAGIVLTQVGGSGLTGSVDLTGATNDTDAANFVTTYMDAVSRVNQTFNPDVGYSKVRPLNDIVTVSCAAPKSFTISKCDIVISTGNTETTKARAEQLISEYLDDLRSNLAKDAVKSKLSGPLANLDGVYSATIEFDAAPAKDIVTSAKNEYLTASVPTVNVTVLT
jgi:phage-related baseplate assembly protein